MWFETHAHLSDPKFDSDREDVIARAFSSGLSAIVEIADGPDEWSKAQQLAEKYLHKIWWAAGLHPYYADQSSDEAWKSLRKLTEHSQFVAIGEVGLDYAKSNIPANVQIPAFENAIKLSFETDKPLIIHCREAYSDLMPLIRKYFQSHTKDTPGVVHCFSGNRDQAQELISMGFYLGVDGPITYPNAKSLRESLDGIDPNYLVLETDSPYLPPQTHRGQRNEPSYLPQIGVHLAQLCKKSPAQLSEITFKNSKNLFRINPS